MIAAIIRSTYVLLQESSLKEMSMKTMKKLLPKHVESSESVWSKVDIEVHCSDLIQENLLKET